MNYPTTVFFWLLCLCLWTPIAPAQLLLTEDFDYPAGDSLKLHDWTMTGSPSSYSYVNPVMTTAPGLEYPGYRGSGLGNAVSLAQTGQDVSRYFDAPAKEGSVYAFLMVRVAAARSAGDYFFHLVGGPATSSVFAPKLSVKASDGRLAFGISKRANANTASYTGFNYGIDTTYLVVLKYRFIPEATTDDEVSLFVFGPTGVPSSEPVTPAVGPVTEPTGADVDTLCLCGLRQGSSSSAPIIVVDGIRITTAWERALPVQISSFQATLEDAATITLTWATQSEIDNYGFEVQRSSNDEDGFVSVSGVIPGHNTTAEPHTYAFTDYAVPAGRWFYRLKSISLDQSVSYSTVIEVANTTSVAHDNEVPTEFALMQNYPNPFNPKTGVRFQVPPARQRSGGGVSDVKLTVYDLLGREVAVLVNERKAPGRYEVSFDGSRLASGVYLYRMTAGSWVGARKMILAK